MAPVVFGYWGARGLGNQVMLLMEHVGQPYQFRNWDDEKPSWLEQKYKLGLRFPNLPYLIDGDVQLTQSSAIIRYLARKHGLYAKTESQIRDQDQFENVLHDLVVNMAMLTFGYIGGDPEENKKKFVSDKAMPVLREFEQQLANRKYLLGDNLNFTDFILFERLDTGFKELLPMFPNLQKYHERMMNLKGIKEYMASDRMPKEMIPMKSVFNPKNRK